MKKQTVRTGAALAVSVLLALIYAVIVYKGTGFLYAIADDVIMRDIASGAFTGTPDGHLIFIRYVLGFCISRLYMLNRTVDWYGFFMAGALFLGLAAVLYRGLSGEKTFCWKAVYTCLAAGIFGCSMVFHAAQFEWTISAAMVGASALYLYATGKKDSVLEDIFVWLLLFFTFCIRTDVFFMVMPGFGIAFLWKTVRKEEGKLCFEWKNLILPAAVFLSAGAVMLAEQKAYEGKEWEEFQRFQPARSQVYDYTGVPSYEENPEFFETLGIDEKEVRNLRHYALNLVDGMDADMMEDLSEESKRQAGESGVGETIKSGIRLAAQQIAEKEYFSVSLPALALTAGTILLVFKRRRQELVPLTLFFCAQGLLWLALGIMGRLPERVAFSMHLPALLGTGAFFFRAWEEEERQERTAKFMRYLPAAAVVLFLGIAAVKWPAIKEANEAKLAMDENYQLFKAECREMPEKKYFIETYMAEPVGGAEVTASGDFRLSNCLTLGDWYTTSPLDRQRQEALGIRDIEETILTDPNAYLVIRDTEDTGFLGDYFEEKYPGCVLKPCGIKTVEGRNYYLYQPEMEE